MKKIHSNCKTHKCIRVWNGNKQGFRFLHFKNPLKTYMEKRLHGVNFIIIYEILIQYHVFIYYIIIGYILEMSSVKNQSVY